MGESEHRSSWSFLNLRDSVDKFITDVGFPQMERPDGFGDTYKFPTDVSKLRSEELGNLQLRISGWLSYGLHLQGKEDTELGAFQSIYDIKLWAAVANENGKHPVTKRSLTKDELRAKIIEEDDEFARLTQNLILRTAKVQRLKMQNQIFSEQLTRLSREQSRRDAEMRLLG